MWPKLREISEGEELPQSLATIRSIIEEAHSKVLIALYVPLKELWKTKPGDFISQRKKLFFLLNCCDRSLIFILLAKIRGLREGNLVIFEYEVKSGGPRYHCGIEIWMGDGKNRTQVFYDPARNNFAIIGQGELRDYFDSRKILDVKETHRISFERITEEHTVRTVMEMAGLCVDNLISGEEAENFTPENVYLAGEQFLGRIGGIENLQKARIRLHVNEIFSPF